MADKRSSVHSNTASNLKVFQKHSETKDGDRSLHKMKSQETETDLDAGQSKDDSKLDYNSNNQGDQKVRFEEYDRSGTTRMGDDFS